MDYLFDAPWYLPIAIGLAGIVVLFMGLSRGQNGTRTIGLAVALLGILIGAVSYIVDTDLEKCERRTRLIVDSVESGDWTTFQAQLNKQTSLFMFRGDEQITNVAKYNTERFGLQRASIIGMNSSQQNGAITIDIAVYTELNEPTPPRTQWRFNYQVMNDGILLASIESLDFGSTIQGRVRQGP